MAYRKVRARRARPQPRVRGRQVWLAGRIVFVAVLTMADGTLRESIDCADPDTATQLGLYSLLDADVASFRVELRVVKD